MRPLFQSHWHGIPFSSLGVDLSLTNLPDTHFYSAFYKEFHSRYSSPKELQSEWLEYKYAVGSALMNHIPTESSVISVGAGLALIEDRLASKGYNSIDVHEVSSEPLKWAITNNLVRSTFVSNTISSLKTSSYDFVLLNGLEYALDDASLYQFLLQSLSLLTKNGCLVLISVSFDQDNLSIRKRIKDSLLYLYNRLGFVDGTQLWGYIRKQSELIKLVSQFPGYAVTVEELPITSTWPTLLIKLKRN